MTRGGAFGDTAIRGGDCTFDPLAFSDHTWYCENCIIWGDGDYHCPGPASPEQGAAGPLAPTRRAASSSSQHLRARTGGGLRFRGASWPWVTAGTRCLVRAKQSVSGTTRCWSRGMGGEPPDLSKEVEVSC